MPRLDSLGNRRLAARMDRLVVRRGPLLCAVLEPAHDLEALEILPVDAIDDPLRFVILRSLVFDCERTERIAPGMNRARERCCLGQSRRHNSVLLASISTHMTEAPLHFQKNEN